MDSTLEQARRLFLDGVAHYQAGRLAQAERQFAGALALAPGRPSVLTNLGAVRLKLGRAEDALLLLEEALAQEPGNAEALGHAGTALAELGRLPEALAMFERSLEADARPAVLWMFRGSALRELGRRDEAAECFREALARGGDAPLLHYYLAGLQQEEVPGQPPRHYVQGLFDSYADSFDAHVVRELGYEAPRLLVERLARGGRRYAQALDLGCGTGLCGRLLRPLCDRLTGVDLSPNMLEKARATGAYDDLQLADVAEFLAGSSAQFDAVVAADVFIYVGALDEVFRLLAQRMAPGAPFCFTVEESTSEELALRASLRYAHSEGLVRRLADEHGFRVTALERRPVRNEQHRPIPGLFVWLEKA